VEKQFIAFRQQQGDEMEQKIHSLQGQVSLLSSLANDLKADKQQSKDRENDLQSQVKEALEVSGKSRTELKRLQQTSGQQRDKLRSELETARENAAQENAQWKEQSALN